MIGLKVLQSVVQQLGCCTAACRALCGACTHIFFRLRANARPAACICPAACRMEFISQWTVCTTQHSLAFMQNTFQVGRAAAADSAEGPHTGLITRQHLHAVLVRCSCTLYTCTHLTATRAWVGFTDRARQCSYEHACRQHHMSMHAASISCSRHVVRHVCCATAAQQ